MDPELQDFLAKKHLLLAAQKEGVQLAPRPANRRVGLVNSGATCYMNSVLQCLLQIPQFGAALQESTSTASLVTELKRLWSFLQHSDKQAVRTTDLQAAFGWTGSQRNEQHDAHEFYSMLVDTLSEAGLQKALEGVFQGSTIGRCTPSPVTYPLYPTLYPTLYPIPV